MPTPLVLIYGHLAGVYYAKSGIPQKWIQNLKKLDLIESIIKGLSMSSDEANFSN